MPDITIGEVVRGLKNENMRPFDSEHLDIHGRLLDASVNCIQGSFDSNQIRIGMPASISKYGFRSSKMKKIIQKGGRVLAAPIKDNPNHCLLSGLKISDANQLFSKPI